jgi:hypothetical protein
MIKYLKIVFILTSFAVSYNIAAQNKDCFAYETSIIRNANIFRHKEIDTANNTMLVYRFICNFPDGIGAEFEKIVLINVKEIDNLTLNRAYTLPDDRFLVKTNWNCDKDQDVFGTITRIEKNELNEVFKLQLKIYDENSGVDTLMWGDFIFNYNCFNFKNILVDNNEKFNSIKIGSKEPDKVKNLNLSIYYKDLILLCGYEFLLIKELPFDIGRFENLEKLVAKLLHLNKLPEGFRKLKNLQELDLSYNEFFEFPSQVLSCKTLVSLSLENNRINYIPTEIVKLSELQKLNISDNDFTSFQWELSSLTELRELSIRSCAVRYIPKKIRGLSKLEILDVGNSVNSSAINSFNFIDSLENISLLTNLEKLYLDGTGLRSIPEEFSNLKSLETLNIKHNHFNSFPEVINQIPNLKLLIIHHGQFDEQTIKRLKDRNVKYKIQTDLR